MQLPLIFNPSVGVTMHCLIFVALLLAAASPVAAQSNYPTKPIRLVVPFPPGAANDVVARAVALKLSDNLGQPLVVDNRSGAGGSLGGDIVAKAPADGYTLMLNSTSYVTRPAVDSRMPFDPVKDLTAFALIGRGPLLIAVSNSLPAKSIKELVALARSQPGKLNYASSGIGGSPHLTAELFLQLTGIDMTHVPYKGLGLAMADLISGRVHLVIASLPTTGPNVKAGRLRALAVTSAQRSSFMPGLPTAIESGVPGYVAELWWGMFAPARTPVTVISRLHAEIGKSVASDDLKRLLSDSGAEPETMTTAAFGQMVRNEIAMWTKLVKSRGIKGE